jgi:hypothetical protein
MSKLFVITAVSICKTNGLPLFILLLPKGSKYPFLPLFRFKLQPS